MVDLSCIDGDLTMKNGELMIYFDGIEWGEEFGEQDRKIYGKSERRITCTLWLFNIPMDGTIPFLNDN